MIILIYFCTLKHNIMGYTHYYTYKPKVGDDINFKEVLREVKILKRNLPEHSTTAGANYSEYPITLRNGMGKGLPEITEELIRFNGDESKGLDHETFVFKFKEEEQGDFCKTARKPYDMFVCLCLISLANNLEGFTFSSDGDEEDWEPAFKFYEQHIGENKAQLVW